MSDTGYRVVRFYKDARNRRWKRSSRTIIKRCTLAEAHAHCGDKETSSSTCTNASGKARTRRLGQWFDGYEER